MANVNDGMTDKLKILCLHGYRQNGDVFKNKLGAFRKIVKPYADLIFITAEHKVHQTFGSCQHDLDRGHEESSETSEGINSVFRGWWFSKPDNGFNAHDVSDISTGFEHSVDTVKNAVTKQGPFDGVLGFSQGAALAYLLCSLQQKDRVAFAFKFAILIAGFKSGSRPHQELYEEVIHCPSLHIFGETDTIIPKEMSEELLKQFETPTVLIHPGGHFTPATTSQKKDYKDFLEKMLYHCNKLSIK